jgi:hypothetical protein
VYISSANRDCNYKGLNQAVNSRFKSKSALFGTLADAIIEAGLASFYAYSGDTAGQDQSVLFKCVKDGMNGEDLNVVMEECMAFVSDAFQISAATFSSALGTF